MCGEGDLRDVSELLLHTYTDTQGSGFCSEKPDTLLFSPAHPVSSPVRKAWMISDDGTQEMCDDWEMMRKESLYKSCHGVVLS